MGENFSLVVSWFRNSETPVAPHHLSEALISKRGWKKIKKRKNSSHNYVYFSLLFWKCWKDKATQALIWKRGSCSQLWPRLLFNMSSFLFSKGWKETDVKGWSSHTLESISMKVAESARLVEYQLQALLQKKLDTWDQFVMCPTFRLPQLGVWSERDLFDKIPVEKLELKFSKVE